MFKKLLSIILLSAMIFSTFSVMPVLAKKDGKKHTAGSLIKAKGQTNVYYIGDDGKRYVFPNSKTYFSWFDDFSKINEVEMENLSDYELAGNVTYKPGALLVKIQSDPKVYAVGTNGILRWIKTEKIAKNLYGNNWNKLIDDVPVQFFGNYKKGDVIDDEEDFEPVEEEEQVPTISHNKGFKPLVRAKVRNRVQNMCGRLEGALQRLQKRFERWGSDITDESDEVLEKCYGIKDDIIDQIKDKKVKICHKGETLLIAAPAIKAHLRHGDRLGACEGDNDQDDGQVETDETAPIISSVADDPSGTSAAITWTTDENANSKVYYSTSTGAISSTLFEESSTNVISHSIDLTGLTASTTYYYVVESEDESGNVATSTEAMFTTLDEVVADETAPIISSVADDPSETSAAITWTTDENANSKVYYSTSTGAISSTLFEESSTNVISHSIDLTGLTASTTYYYVVESEDESGNVATSTEAMFTTLY